MSSPLLSSLIVIIPHFSLIVNNIYKKFDYFVNILLKYYKKIHLGFFAIYVYNNMNRIIFL